MPELPEVETTVRGLGRVVVGGRISGVWSDIPQKISVYLDDGRKQKNSSLFKKEIIGKSIKDVRRRGKNILFFLSSGRVLLIHQKISGHLLFGNWHFENGLWKTSDKSLSEKINSYIHLVVTLGSNKMIALSDPRKFVKIELFLNKDFVASKLDDEIGPDPTEKEFTLPLFKTIVSKSRMPIKKVLMDQRRIAGIGNIYADEVLWNAKVNPFRSAMDLNDYELKRIFGSIGMVLKKAIELKGNSFSDYRLISGAKGKYQEIQRVYRREGLPCFRNDGGIINRKKIGNRSSYFCPICQR